MRSQRANLNPTPEAVAAMYLFSTEYSSQRGGSMDFWNGLPDSKKNMCNNLVEEVLAAHKAHA